MSQISLRCVAIKNYCLILLRYPINPFHEMVHLRQTEDATFLDDDQVENAEIGINDATTDRLALALAGPAGTVAGVALAEQQAHTAVGQHTLLHGEALLVVASADAHHITLQK